MTCLNGDILFEIGKKIVEDGNSDAVYRFALSGKEPLNAMKRVFASVTSLELYENFYGIGWGKILCRFKFEKNEPLLKCLVNQIGNRVIKLRINCLISIHKKWLKKLFNKYFKTENNTVYRKIINRIIAKKQLISFSAGENCSQKFFDRFLPKFSATLKNITIPCEKMSEKLRDSNLDLDKLTIVENYCTSNLRNCCKTKSLDVDSLMAILISFQTNQISPHFSSVKELIINDSGIYFYKFHFFQILEYFPSLENLRFNYERNFPGISGRYFIQNFVQFLTGFINIATTRVPSNIIFSVNKKVKHIFNGIYDLCAELDMKYDESIIEYSCFCKTFHNDDGSLFTNVEFRIYN